MKGLEGLIRSRCLREVSSSALAVYLVLRTYEWRSTTRGRKELVKMRKEGKLAASLSHSKIEDLTGFAKNTVKRALADLRSAGWIEVDSVSSGRRVVYVLGELVEGKESYHAEGSKIDPLRGQKLTHKSEKRGVKNCPGEGSKIDPLRGQKLTQHPKLIMITHNEELITRDPKHVATAEIRKVRRTKKFDPKHEDEEPLLPPLQALKRFNAWDELAEQPKRRRASPSLVEDPVYPERKLHPEEAKHLASARAKIDEGRRGDYTGAEAVAVWRMIFFEAFGFEDPAVSTSDVKLKRSLAALFTSSYPELGGNVKAWEYLRGMIVKWSQKGPEDRWPPGKAPRFVDLLTKTKRGWPKFYTDWLMEKET